MAFPSTTYIPQRAQPADLAPDFPRHGFSYQHTTHSAHPRAPISVGHTASSTLQTQDLACRPDLLSHPYVQTLERRLDMALKKAREYEDTILHQATLSRHFLSFLKTQHGIVCPDCKQEVAHVCSSPNSLITSSSLQLPSTLFNPAGLRAHVSSPSAQGNTFESVTPNGPLASSTSHVQPLPPLSLMSNSFNSHPSTATTLGNLEGWPMRFVDPTAQESCFGEHVAGRSAPNLFESSVCHVRPPRQNSISSLPPPPPPPGRLTVSSSGAMSSGPPLCGPGSSSAIHSQYDSCNDNSWLGKRDVHHADLECEQERKRARSSLLEERHTNQQGEFHPSQALATFGPCLPSFKDSLPEDGIASELESDAGWSITYNSEVEREVEVSMLRPLETAPNISCLKFSKDGKYLAVGFFPDATTNIYDVETGEKTCTLKEFTYYEKEDENMHIDAVCFSPNSLYLATGGDVVRIWEISKKHVRNVLKSFNIEHVDFSPDGRLIAITSESLECIILEIWNWRDGSRIFFQELDFYGDIRFSPNGRHIAAMGGGDVLIWHVRTNQLVAKPIWHGVTCFAFMPDGTGLVSGFRESGGCVGIRFFGSRLQDGRLRLTENNTKANIGEDQDALFVAVSSNSRWVVSCSPNSFLHIYNAESTGLHCLLSPRMPKEGTTIFDFSPVSGFVAVSTWREAFFVHPEKTFSLVYLDAEYLANNTPSDAESKGNYTFDGTASDSIATQIIMWPKLVPHKTTLYFLQSG